MKKTHAYAASIALGFCLLPSVALAHSGQEGATRWFAGFTHPLYGWDHLVAMIASGLWAAQQSGRAMWAIPISFLSLMTVGGLVGISGLAVPGAEVAIGLSVVAFGVLVLRRTRVSAALGAGVVGLFAAFHGFAHGAEMPPTATLLEYGLGFLGATALLHGAGFIAMRIIAAVSKGLRRQAQIVR